MDFSIDERSELFRAEVREFVAQHLTPEMRQQMLDTGSLHDWDFYRALSQQGWIGAAWPPEEGGRALDPANIEILYQELAAAGAPTDGFSMSMIIAETLRRIGTPELRQLVIPRVQAGDLVIALGYSEPDAGSDLASVKTSARRDGDGWRINGQKVFTTLAHEAGYVFLLARSDPEQQRHRGLTVFLVPTDAPGFSLTPVHTLGGERTNVTFYSDIWVPDWMRVGEVGGGWSVVMLALAFERGGEFAAQLRRLVESTAEWAAAENLSLDRRLMRRLGKVAVDAEVARLLGARAAWLRSGHNAGDIEGNIAKVYATERLLAGAGQLLDAAGVLGQLPPGDSRAPAHGHIEHTYRHAQVTTIYGGTNDVLRGVIAERRLGLPRSRPAVASPRPDPNGAAST